MRRDPITNEVLDDGRETSDSALAVLPKAAIIQSCCCCGSQDTKSAKRHGCPESYFLCFICYLAGYSAEYANTYRQGNGLPLIEGLRAPCRRP